MTQNSVKYLRILKISFRRDWQLWDLYLCCHSRYKIAMCWLWCGTKIAQYQLYLNNWRTPPSSVSDPFHFDTDPCPDLDLRIQFRWLLIQIRICGSTSDDYGSGSGQMIRIWTWIRNTGWKCSRYFCAIKL